MEKMMTFIRLIASCAADARVSSCVAFFEGRHREGAALTQLYENFMNTASQLDEDEQKEFMKLLYAYEHEYIKKLTSEQKDYIQFGVIDSDN